MGELLGKIPTERCWAITTKILTSLFVMRGENIIAPLLGKDEGIIAPVMGAEKWIEINVKIFGDGSKILFPMFKEMFNIPVEDAIDASDLAKVVVTLAFGPDQPAKIIEATPKRTVQRLTTCVWTQRYEEFEADPAFTACDKGGCQAWGEEGFKVVNPKITWTVTKSMPRGDPYCEFVYEFKEE